MIFQSGYERGFGTFPLKGGELADALEIALEVGYRAIDTAQMYQNEADVGKVLNASTIPRKELCLTSKVPIEKFDTKTFLPSVQQSLDDLQTDYVDVLLLHWPPADGQIEQPLEWLLEAKQRGYAKNLGISNFTSAMMRRVLELSDEPMVTNQVEFHPLLDQSILLKTAEETGIPLSSYCSVARGKALTAQPVLDIAERLQRSPAQIVLRWILQQGVSINTMSTRRENIRANFDVMDFTLSDSDMQSIATLGSSNFRIVNKDLVPWAPVWD